MRWMAHFVSPRSPYTGFFQSVPILRLTFLEPLQSPLDTARDLIGASLLTLKGTGDLVLAA